MFWQIIAVLCVGFSTSGIILAARFFCKKIPGWTVPAFAGLAMIGFQISGEYTWYSHQRSILPDGVNVLGTIEESVLWRPWSMVVPQTTKFLAADNRRVAADHVDPSAIRITLYAFERGRPAQRLSAVVNCDAASGTADEQRIIDNTILDHSYILDSDDYRFEICTGL